MENRYELNKELAQMLKCALSWMLLHRNRQKIAEEQVPVPLWHWKEFRQTIRMQQAVSQE